MPDLLTQSYNLRSCSSGFYNRVLGGLSSHIKISQYFAMHGYEINPQRIWTGRVTVIFLCVSVSVSVTAPTATHLSYRDTDGYLSRKLVCRSCASSTYCSPIFNYITHFLECTMVNNGITVMYVCLLLIWSQADEQIVALQKHCLNIQKVELV